jgi:hypothetical protein
VHEKNCDVTFEGFGTFSFHGSNGSKPLGLHQNITRFVVQSFTKEKEHFFTRLTAVKKELAGNVG